MPLALLKSLFGHDIQCVGSNHELLISWNDADFHLAVVVGDGHFRGPAAVVFLNADFHTEEFKSVGSALAHFPLVLSCPTGEHDDIYATHGSRILSDVFLDTVGVHFLGQTRAVVSFRDGFENVAEIAESSADTSKS